MGIDCVARRSNDLSWNPPTDFHDAFDVPIIGGVPFCIPNCNRASWTRQPFSN